MIKTSASLKTASKAFDKISKSFSQDLYSRIEKFFDQEDLFIASSSPVKSCIILLKPSLRMVSNPSTACSEESDQKDQVDLAIPEFLKRRRVSCAERAENSVKPQRLGLLNKNTRQVKSLSDLPL